MKMKSLLLIASFLFSINVNAVDLKYGVARDQNKRDYQEDRDVQVSIRTRHSKKIGSFFAVYDGHGGPQIAQFLKENLHEYFRNAPGSVQEKMNVAFKRADNADFVKENKKVGSTASVVFVEHDKIHFINTGDSRAVLEKNGVVCFATQDHKPNSEDERKRITAANGHVFFYAKAWRVNGALAVSRAIGDWYIDKTLIIPDPEYTEIHLTKENRFLIVASDGLWDKVTNEDAVTKLREYYANNKNLNNAAMYLAGLAIAGGSSDNITIMVVDLLSGN